MRESSDGSNELLRTNHCLEANLSVSSHPLAININQHG